MKRHQFKREIAALLGAIMVFTAIPVNGLCAEADDATSETVAVEMDEEVSSTGDIEQILDGVIVDAEDNESVYDSSVEEDSTMESDSSEVENTTEENTIIEETTVASDEVELAEQKSFLVDENGVLKLAENARIGSKMTIPAECKIIPIGIFDDNKDIQVLYFEDSANTIEIEAKAFEGCTELTDIYCKNATIIGERAFRGCSKLKNVLLNKAEVISDEAFLECKELKSITFSENVQVIGNKAFMNTALESADLSKMITCASLGESVFEGCKKLTYANIPGCVSAIQPSMFAGCSALVDVNIGAGVQTISEKAFDGCINLAQVSMPASVNRISNYAFSGCEKLATVVVMYPETEDALVIENYAFPLQKNNTVTFRAYNKLVEQYVDYMNSRGAKYKCEILAERYKINVTATNGTIEQGVKEARTGDKITLTLVPKSGYTAFDDKRYLSIKTANTLEDIPYELAPLADGKVKLTFVMPTKSVEVKANFQKIDIPRYNYFSPEIGVGTGYTFDEASRKLNFDRTGVSTAPLRVHAKAHNGDDLGLLPPWLFTYKSSNDAVTVDVNGVIKAAKKCKDVTVTATLSCDTSKRVAVKVDVGEELHIEKIDFAFSNYPNSVALYDPDNYDPSIYYPVEVRNGDYVVEIPSTRVKGGNVKISTKVLPIRLGHPEDGYQYGAPISWASTDGNIASVTTTATETSLVIKKNATGEATLTATITNPKNSDGKVIKVTRNIVVKIIDITPRLIESDVKVNYESSVGTEVHIVPVYGTEIDTDAGFSLYTKKMSGGIEKEIPCGDLGVVYNSAADTYNIFAFDTIGLTAGATKTYTDTGALYIRGYYQNNASEGIVPGIGETFDVKVPKLTVTRLKQGEKLKTTAKVSGKINLFYRNTDSQCGNVTVALGDINEHLELVYLTTTDTTDSPIVDNALANNFVASVVDNKTVRIERSSNTLANDAKGKLVTSGYLYLKYAGLKYYIKVKVSIPTATTAPSYALSSNAVTANVYSQNQEFAVELIDKKTKKPVDLEAGVEVSTNSPIYSTRCDEETDRLVIETNGTPVNQKFNIIIKQPTWYNSVSYAYTVKTTNTLPTIKASKTTVTLNKKLYTQGDNVEFKITNQVDARLGGFKTWDSGDIALYTGSAKNEPESRKITFTQLSDDKLGIAINDDSIIKGSYTFKLIPQVSYTTDVLDGKPISVTVKIIDTVPTIKLSKSSATVNVTCPGNEVVSLDYKVNNLPLDKSYKVVGTPSVVATKEDPYVNTVLRNLDFDYSEDGKIKINLTSGYTLKTAFNYTFVVKNFTLSDENSGNNVTLSDFKISIKGIDKTPTLKVKTTGKFNTIDSNSEMLLALSVDNITSAISAIAVYDVDEKTGAIKKDDCSSYFTLYDVSENTDNSLLKFSADYEKMNSLAVNLSAKKTYKYVLGYVLASDPQGEVRYSSVMSIKPKQTYPKLSSTQIGKVVFAGARYDKRYIEMRIVPSDMKGARVNGAHISAKNAANIKEAFEVSAVYPELIQTGFDALGAPTYDESGAYIVCISLKTPSRLVLNKDYKVIVEPTYENEIDDSAGPSVVCTVTVKK